ncbi:MAG: hypothetical protein ACI8W8_004431 [Rhodothermales bacterium]|jgi:hypothetical protein
MRPGVIACRMLKIVDFSEQARNEIPAIEIALFAQPLAAVGPARPSAYSAIAAEVTV